MSEGINIGVVKGTVELEDQMSSALDLLEHKIESLDTAFGGFGAHVAEQATSFFTAEAALGALTETAKLAADTLKDITIEGSHAADIEDTFQHLTENAGLLGDTLLDKTRKGLQGTVTDMDIMTRVNQNLAVGLNLTDDQMEVLAKGAFALAKASGGDAAGGLDKLSDAMVTGRVKGIGLLTGKIDLVAAEHDYADSLGKSFDRLTEQEKQYATQQIILQKVAEATDRIGDVHIRLADKIQQVKVEYANFMEELGTAVATSPVISAGFDGIRSAIEGAFGQNQAGMVRSIAHEVDSAAIEVLQFGEYAADAAGVVMTAWHEGLAIFDSIKAGWAAIGYIGANVYELWAKFQNAVNLGMGGYGEQAKFAAHASDMFYESMAKNSKGIDDNKAAEDQWAIVTGHVKDAIEGVRQKMVDAQKNEGEYTDVIRDNNNAHHEGTVAAGGHARAEKEFGDTAGMTKEQIQKYTNAWADLNSMGGTWQDTLAGINPEQVAQIQYYLRAGASIEELATAYPKLTKAEIESVKAGETAAKAAYDASETLGKAYEDYYAKKASLGADDGQKAIIAADKDYAIHVEELQKKGIADVTYYNQLWDLRNKDVQLATQQRIHDDVQSKAHLDQVLTDQKSRLDLMRSNTDQFTQEDIAAQQKVVDGLKEQRRHWGELGTTMGQTGKDGVTAFDSVLDAIDAMNGGLDASKIKVKTLSGDLISLEEARKRFDDGGSYAVTSQNFEQSLQSIITSGGWNPSGMGSNIDVQEAWKLAQKGYSFQEIIDIFNRMKNGAGGTIPPPQGPRIPGFRDGGIGDFGDGTLAMLHGKEAIVPLGAGSQGGLGGAQVHFGAGAVVLNYPLMNDPRAMNEFALHLGAALEQRLAAVGIRSTGVF